MFTSDSLLTILKTTDTLDELRATTAKVDHDIARQRSKDSGGNDGKIMLALSTKSISLRRRRTLAS